MICLLELLLSILVVGLIIKFLYSKGISIGSMKKNFPIKFFLAFMLLGIFLRINFLFPPDYLLKDIIEPVVSVAFIYLIIALLNRNGFLDRQKINIISGGLYILAGIAIFTLGLMI